MIFLAKQSCYRYMYLLRIIIWVTVFACLKTILTTKEEDRIQNDIPSHPDPGSHSSDNYCHLFMYLLSKCPCIQCVCVFKYSVFLIIHTFVFCSSAHSVSNLSEIFPHKHIFILMFNDVVTFFVWLYYYLFHQS